jgi:O-phospho-L-seryl-tRNASec:L-selenocysteinyl-tRNA synthase
VIWSRIDQKSCFKAILTAGLVPLIVAQVLVDDQLTTDMITIRDLLVKHENEILCVISTTSCFAPRQPDQVDQVALACKEMNTPHLVNNAYGLQCDYICKLLNRAATIGRLDYVVQSTDKNFLVPVGGAVVFSPSVALIDLLAGIYPGRAGSGPVLDLFITLLAMGETGYRRLLQERNQLLPVLQEGLLSLCREHCEKGWEIIKADRNSISLAVAIGECDGKELTFLGSMLFNRNVSGCRVVPSCPDKVTMIGGYEFRNWGAHSTLYPCSYFTAACAIGTSQKDVNEFLTRLRKVSLKFYKKYSAIDEDVGEA